MNTHFVYILLCADSTLYTGYTNDIDKRILSHNSGRGAKYTRGRLPVKLLYYEKFISKSEALKREVAIKKKTKAQKLKIIEESKGDLIEENNCDR